MCNDRDPRGQGDTLVKEHRPHGSCFGLDTVRLLRVRYCTIVRCTPLCHPLESKANIAHSHHGRSCALYNLYHVDALYITAAAASSIINQLAVHGAYQRWGVEYLSQFDEIAHSLLRRHIPPSVRQAQTRCALCCCLLALYTIAKSRRSCFAVQLHIHIQKRTTT